MPSLPLSRQPGRRHPILRSRAAPPAPASKAAPRDIPNRESQTTEHSDLVNGIVLHEMANAIAVVVGAVELINGPATDPATFRFAMQRINGGVRMMGEILRGIGLLLGEGEEAEPQFEHGGLVEFVHELVADPVLVTEDAADRVEVVTRLSDGVEPEYCRPLLRHALSNLIRNALRYSPAGERVTVIVGGRREGGWIHILNRGPKIRTEVAEVLFEPGRKDARGGMGIGLHITRSCALKMRGGLVYGTTARATVFSLLLNPARG